MVAFPRGSEHSAAVGAEKQLQAVSSLLGYGLILGDQLHAAATVIVVAVGDEDV